MRAGLWLFVLLMFYLLGGVASCSTFVIADQITGIQSHVLLGKVRDGMTPAEVEAIIGRSSEYQQHYACTPDCGPFSHNWTVQGHRLEVIFDQSGHATQRFTYPSEPGAVSRFFRWVFLWWLPDFD
jgi:hypothetical protein